MNAHAGLGAFVRVQEEDFAAAGAAGGDHAFAEAELHFSRLQVGDADDLASDEFFRFVSCLDAGEDVAGFAAAE